MVVLDLEKRIYLNDALADGVNIRDIAARLGVGRTTIHHELRVYKNNHAGYDYDPYLAQKDMEQRMSFRRTGRKPTKKMEKAATKK